MILVKIVNVGFFIQQKPRRRGLNLGRVVDGRFAAPGPGYDPVLPRLSWGPAIQSAPSGISFFMVDAGGDSNRWLLYVELWISFHVVSMCFCCVFLGEMSCDVLCEIILDVSQGVHSSHDFHVAIELNPPPKTGVSRTCVSGDPGNSGLGGRPATPRWSDGLNICLNNPVLWIGLTARYAKDPETVFWGSWRPFFGGWSCCAKTLHIKVCFVSCSCFLFEHRPMIRLPTVQCIYLPKDLTGYRWWHVMT